jgi:uncharacterized RDD family membrane protein YckC
MEQGAMAAPGMAWMAQSARWQRLGAALVDLALVAGIQLLVSQTFGVLHAESGFYSIAGNGVTAMWGAAPALSYGQLCVVVVAYFALFEGLFAVTPGKALFGLRVVTLDGGRPSLRAILVRNVLRLVDALPGFYIVGAISINLSTREQRLGDRAAGTMVVRERGADGARDDETERALPWRRGRIALVGMLFALLLGGCAVFQYVGRPPLVVRSWANANSETWFDTSAPGAPPLCGPMRPVPFPGEPAQIVIPRHISVYTLGAPRWDGTRVTYPLRFELIPAEQTDHGGSSADAREVTELPLGGPVYAGSITLRWAGPLAGWQVEAGVVSC